MSKNSEKRYHDEMTYQSPADPLDIQENPAKKYDHGPKNDIITESRMHRENANTQDLIDDLNVAAIYEMKMGHSHRTPDEYLLAGADLCLYEMELQAPESIQQNLMMIFANLAHYHLDDESGNAAEAEAYYRRAERLNDSILAKNRSGDNCLLASRLYDDIAVMHCCSASYEIGEQYLTKALKYCIEALTLAPEVKGDAIQAEIDIYSDLIHLYDSMGKSDRKAECEKWYDKLISDAEARKSEE